MAQMIFGGDSEFDALIYRDPHPNTMAYLQNQIQQAGQFLLDSAKGFFTDRQAMFDQHFGSEAMRLAKAALRKTRGIFQRDEIQPLTDIGQMQNAQPVMQRWMMAQPYVRNMYHRQRCEGYPDSYVDMHPGMIGRDHYDFRRVMQGVIVEDDDGGWSCTNFFDELYEGDRELVIEEKTDILTSWDLVEHFMKFGEEDPVSPTASKL